MITTHRASTGLIEKYVGTAYDHVKLVGDNLDSIKKLADSLSTEIDFEALAKVLEILGENVDQFAALSQADLALISEDLIKGNYLGNRKMDINLALNNESESTEVTYESATIVTNYGVIIEIPFTITDSQGNTVVQELASYTAIYNAIVNGIAAYNASEPNPQLHVSNTEIDIINSTLPDLPTMIRIRDADGQASNIDRIELQVHSGEALNYRPAYFWAKTTSALQTLANRVGDIISLGNDIDSIVLLASQRDEIETLYNAREMLFEDTQSIYQNMTQLQALHTELTKLLQIQSNLPAVTSLYNNMSSILYNEENMQFIVDAQNNAQIAKNQALLATDLKNETEGFRDETFVFRNEAETFKNSAEASAVTATDKANEIKALGIDQTLTGSAGTNASVIYNSLQNKFTFVIPRGDKGDRGEAFQVNAIGTSGQRSNYDNQNEGFSFLDSTNSSIYFKLSNTAGDWSAGSPFGKGDQGDQGVQGVGVLNVTFKSTTDASNLPGASGATDTYSVNLSDNTSHDFTVKNGIDSAVLSVAGKQGNVTLVKADVGLGNVDNTSDLTKPMSNATKMYIDNGLNEKKSNWINTTAEISKVLQPNERCIVTVPNRTITLPAVPVIGSTVIVTVCNFDNTVIARNGNKIMSLDENLEINKPFSSVKLYFTGITRGWVLIL